jgi:hypothetical protein
MSANLRGTEINMDANQSAPSQPREGVAAPATIDSSPALGATLKKRMHSAMLCVLLLAALLAAWEGHKLFSGGRHDRQPSSGPAISSGALDSGAAPALSGRGAPAMDDQWAASGPAAFLAGPAGDMVPASADPGGIAPPPGSSRSWCYRGKAGGLALENARYDAPGDLETLAGYYLQAMKDRSFTCAGQKKVSSGRVVVVFIRDATKVTLILQTDLSRNNIVRVFISVMRPLEAPRQ